MKEKAFKISIVAIFILAVFLRFEAYFFNASFWYDESALALNIINRSFLGLLKPLDYTQCAPYGFLILSKLITKLFGTSEYAFRFLPFLTSILSIPAFYFLSKKVLNKKWSILIANYLFAVNFHLIYYAQEFKQYSTEVLVSISVLLLLSYVDFKNLSIKKCLLIGFAFTVSFLFSLTSVFILGALIAYLIFANRRKSIKQIFCIILPFIIFALPYYLFCLYPSKTLMMQEWAFLWKPGFIEFNLHHIKRIITLFYNYSFGANYNPIPVIILTVIGSFAILWDKNKTGIIILFLLCISAFASILHIYPILGRLHLYLVPLILLVLVIPFDKISFKPFKDKKTIFSIIFILLFIWCFRVNFIKNIKRLLHSETYAVSFQKQNMEFLKDNMKQGETLLYCTKYDANYTYYAKYFNIKNKIENMYPNSVEYLKTLSKGRIYWLYMDNHIHEADCTPFVKEWINKNDIKKLYEKEFDEIYHGYIVQIKS